MFTVLLRAIESQTQKTLKISLAASSTPILSVLKPDGLYYLVRTSRLLTWLTFPYTLWYLTSVVYILRFSHLSLTLQFKSSGWFIYHSFIPIFTWSPYLHLSGPWHQNSVLAILLELNSARWPHFFGKALAIDFLSLNLSPSHLAQYVDDIVLYISYHHKYILLNFLGNKSQTSVLEVSQIPITH